MTVYDLQALSQLAHHYGSVLVVDDTIANFANIQLLNQPAPGTIY